MGSDFGHNNIWELDGDQATTIQVADSPLDVKSENSILLLNQWCDLSKISHFSVLFFFSHFFLSFLDRLWSLRPLCTIGLLGTSHYVALRLTRGSKQRPNANLDISPEVAELRLWLCYNLRFRFFIITQDRTSNCWLEKAQEYFQTGNVWSQLVHRPQ